MRNGMFINGILTNSEVWIGLKEQHYRELEMADEHLLRGILKAHSKGPKESLYLETGTMPIRFIIKNRRIGYLHQLLTRDEKELISKVYFAQTRKPGKNDWATIVSQDLDEVGITLSKCEMKLMNKENFKGLVKIK